MPICLTLMAGRLVHLVWIQSYTQIADELGQRIKVWSDIEEQYASIEPTAATEMRRQGQLTGTQTHTITMRYTPTLKHTHRLRFGDRYFEIVAITNTHERNAKLTITAKELLGV